MLRVVLDTNILVGRTLSPSGDQHLLALKEYEGIRIMTPVEFLSVLEKDS
jgi:predicted nucleic acid-binding protein